MSKVVINPEYCKGCGMCFDVCPEGLLEFSKELTRLGTHCAVQKNEEKCTACKLCAIVCPESAINVYK